MTKRSFLRPGPLAISAVIAAVVIAALYLAIRKPPYEVDLATVTQGPMTVTINDEGETRVHNIFVVAAPINGRLTRIKLEPGDPVVAQQTIVARMTPTSPDFLNNRVEAGVRAQVQVLEAVIASSSARVEQARAEHNLAAQQQARVEALFKRGFATRAALDIADAAVSRSNAAVSEAIKATEAARFDRDAARANLIIPATQPQAGRSLAVRSPTSGTVMRVAQESEAIVAAGTPLIELGDPRDLEIVTDLLSSDAIRLLPGARVLIDNWGGAYSLNGRVRRIEPFGFTKISALGVEEQRVNVMIDITDPPEKWAKLGHGYRVVIRAVEWESANALQLPVSTLFRNKGKWAVFAVENGRARLVPVTIGWMTDERAELLSGLRKGATVILHPSEKISDDARVEAR